MTEIRRWTQEACTVRDCTYEKKVDNNIHVIFHGIQL